VSRQRSNFALNSGTALLKEGKLTEAIAQLQSAIDADPSYAAPHRSLAEALSREGNAGDAALERQKAEALDKAKP
jgi:protein O-GlcNAc transferase